MLFTVIFPRCDDSRATKVFNLATNFSRLIRHPLTNFAFFSQLFHKNRVFLNPLIRNAHFSRSSDENRAFLCDQLKKIARLLRAALRKITFLFYDTWTKITFSRDFLKTFGVLYFLSFLDSKTKVVFLLRFFGYLCVVYCDFLIKFAFFTAIFKYLF